MITGSVLGSRRAKLFIPQALTGVVLDEGRWWPPWCLLEFISSSFFLFFFLLFFAAFVLELLGKRARSAC